MVEIFSSNLDRKNFIGKWPTGYYFQRIYRDNTWPRNSLISGDLSNEICVFRNPDNRLKFAIP